MKKVSFKVAKAIKEAGYPLQRFQTVSREQFEAGHGYKYSTDENFYSESPSILYPEDLDTIDLYYCPTYIEVWLWLWREKKIAIPITCNKEERWSPYGLFSSIYEDYSDPEEAIIVAIEHLVDNDLIK